MTGAIRRMLPWSVLLVLTAATDGRPGETLYRVNFSKTNSPACEPAGSDPLPERFKEGDRLRVNVTNSCGEDWLISVNRCPSRSFSRGCTGLAFEEDIALGRDDTKTFVCTVAKEHDARRYTFEFGGKAPPRDPKQAQEAKPKAEVKTHNLAVEVDP